MKPIRGDCAYVKWVTYLDIPLFLEGTEDPMQRVCIVVLFLITWNTEIPTRKRRWNNTITPLSSNCVDNRSSNCWEWNVGVTAEYPATRKLLSRETGYAATQWGIPPPPPQLWSCILNRSEEDRPSPLVLQRYSRNGKNHPPAQFCSCIFKWLRGYAVGKTTPPPQFCSCIFKWLRGYAATRLRGYAVGKTTPPPQFCSCIFKWLRSGEDPPPPPPPPLSLVAAYASGYDAATQWGRSPLSLSL